MWNVLGQAATVAQLVGADVGGLISMIIQAAVTAQQNKKECEQLARRVFTVGELRQHLDPEAVQDSQNKIDWKQPHDVQTFTFKELAKATNNFAPDRKIGEGGFGSVYKGRLPNGREVAIKRLGRDSWPGIQEFQAEMSILRSISHKHIVLLFGSCNRAAPQELLPKEKQGDVLVVYEFTENRSLDIHLHGQLSPVTASWKMRIEILLGVSRAIEYLQSYAERPVIHRDVKPSNILLDASWAPRLTDFGLALAWEGPDHEVSVCGTHGFAAPEYVATGTLNLTADVYSFGVVMLEVLTGKKAYSSLEEADSRRRSLVGLAVPLIEAGDLRKMLDRRPAAKPTKRQLDAVGLVAKAAVRCVRLNWKARPPISEVVATLETALELARRDG